MKKEKKILKFYQCKRCNCMFKERKYLKRHKPMCLRCIDCLIQFDNKHLYIKHKLAHLCSNMNKLWEQFHEIKFVK